MGARTTGTKRTRRPRQRISRTRAAAGCQGSPAAHRADALTPFQPECPDVAALDRIYQGIASLTGEGFKVALAAGVGRHDLEHLPTLELTECLLGSQNWERAIEVARVDFQVAGPLGITHFRGHLRHAAPPNRPPTRARRAIRPGWSLRPSPNRAARPLCRPLVEPQNSRVRRPSLD